MEDGSDFEIRRVISDIPQDTEDSGGTKDSRDSDDEVSDLSSERSSTEAASSAGEDEGFKGINSNSRRRRATPLPFLEPMVTNLATRLIQEGRSNPPRRSPRLPSQSTRFDSVSYPRAARTSMSFFSRIPKRYLLGQKILKRKRGHASSDQSSTTPSPNSSAGSGDAPLRRFSDRIKRRLVDDDQKRNRGHPLSSQSSATPSPNSSASSGNAPLRRASDRLKKRLVDDDQKRKRGHTPSSQSSATSSANSSVSFPTAPPHRVSNSAKRRMASDDTDDDVERTRSSPTKKVRVDDKHQRKRVIEPFYRSSATLSAESSISPAQQVSALSKRRLVDDDRKRRGNTSSSPSTACEIEYEVELILGARLDPATGKIKYLVKWKTFGNEENTWEPLTNLINCEDAIQKFCVKICGQV